jgi:hypothetical protein
VKFDGINIEDRLEKEYLEHPIFNELDYYAKFYDSLSFSIMSFMSMGTMAILNIDTYAYSSIKGTIESIKDILKKGKINDAYALLRKYYDSTIINVYTNLYLQNNQSFENFIVSQIENWRKGTETIPEYRIISKYIKESPKLSDINNLLRRDDRYKKIRDRCNDHTHYNFYKHYLLNDSTIYNPNRIKYLNIFAKDIEAIFIQHLAYTFYLNDHYMVSIDYMDSIEMGIQPEEDSQYWVAPFVQEVFDKIIKSKRYDLAQAIKHHTMMQLE